MASTGDEQGKWLKEASTSIKRNSFFMKRALDEDNLREALRYCAAMLGELRTSLLGPQKYYELYMQAFDELRHIELYFADEPKKGRSFESLYELVQHAGNVLPRLYLMCTVGTCFIRSKEGFAKDVLRDLAEMCKGVQHPTRGLFLRSYLCQVSRGLLPDVGSPYEGEGGTITDALDFLLLNFTEMNKLWVRMQHQGGPREKERKEQERQQLADLVGKNLTYISQLEGLSFQLYTEAVLPKVVHQIVQCKDDIAQQYLMQCLIQGFPDDFHLATLDTLLTTCSELQPGVKVFLIMSSLMDRLAAYAQRTHEATGQFEQTVAFEKLQEACGKISESHAEMPLAEVIAMYGSLLDFTVNVYKNDLGSIDSVLEACCKAVQARQGPVAAAAEKRLVSLLTVPLDHYDVVTVLELKNYPGAMALLPPSKCKDMALKIISTLLKHATPIDTEQRTAMLFDFIAPLTTDGEDIDDEDIIEQQSQVARVMRLLHTPTATQRVAVFKLIEGRLLQGLPTRYKYTLPSLIIAVLELVQGIADGSVPLGDDAGEEVQLDKLLLFVLHTIARLVDLTPSLTVLQLYLMAAHAASEVAKLELIAYECYEQAFVIYEESIPDSKEQVTALQTIIASLTNCHVLSQDNRAALVHKTTGYCSKLLKKPDQCRAICLCSHLHWQGGPQGGGAEGVGEALARTTVSATPEGNDDDSTVWPVVVRDASSVMTCLKRALKMANAAQQQSAIRGNPSTEAVSLYVEILNHYLYFFDQGLETITPSVIQNLLELSSNEMVVCKEDKALVAFYNNTLRHIAANQDPSSKVAAKYKQLQLPVV